MKHFVWWLKDSWQTVLVTILLVGCALAVLTFQLGSLVSGFTQAEINYINSLSSVKELAGHPQFLAHKLLTFSFLKLGWDNSFMLRLPSVLFAGLAVLGQVVIARRWYSRRMAALSGVLVLFSSWLLGVGRLALPESSYLLFIPMLWAAIWLYTTPYRRWSFIFLLAGVGLCLYSPGFFWIALVVALWQRKVIIEELSKVGWGFRVLLAICGIVLISPLLWTIVKHPVNLLGLAGLPDSLHNARFYLDNFINLVSAFVWRGPSDPLHNLGRLPLLDVFSGIMLFLGLYCVRFNGRLIRVKILLGCALLFALLNILGGPVTYAAFLPITYMFITGGMAFYLQQWFTVFPRNPLARSIGATLLSVAVVLTAFYHVNRYFIAWPQTPATKQVFRQSLLK